MTTGPDVHHHATTRSCGDMNRVLLLSCMAALTGCGTSVGFLRESASLNQHTYQQQVAAVRYVKSVEASTDINAILCAIPTSDSTPYATTMAELHKKAALQPNQVLESIREDRGYRSWFGFWCTTTLTISADVIELIPPGAPIPTKASNHHDDESAGPCGSAYAQLPMLSDVFKRLYPNAAPLDPPPSRRSFVDACSGLSEEAQQCLQARYLREHVDECRQTFGAMKSRTRRELFNTFLSDFE